MPLPDLEETQAYEIKSKLQGSIVKEFKRFPLNREINPTVIGKLILTEARKIHNALKIRIPKKNDWDKEVNPFNRPHLRLIK